jgi:uncharacterized membrane protein (UPF0182 family)
MSFFETFRKRDLGPPPPPFRFGTRRRQPFPALGRWLAAAVILIVLFIVLNIVKGIYTDWLWFQAEGYSSVYSKTIITKVWLFFAGAGVFLAFFLSNVLLAYRLVRQRPQAGPRIIVVDEAGLRRIILVGIIAGSLFLAVIFGSIAGGHWDTMLRYLNGKPFGEEDPVFGRDIGFFVFSLPALRFIQGWALAAAIVTTIAVAGAYILRATAAGAARLLGGAPFEMTTAIRAHLSGLLVIIIGLFVWRYWLGIFNLSYSTRGPVFGATYTDLHAQIPVTYALMALASLTAVLVVANLFLRRGLWLPLGATSLWVATAIVGGLIYPAIVQRFEVNPNELSKERPYIERNIQFTRQAYALDRIEERTFPAELTVTAEEIAASPQTVDNMRLWDPRPLRDTFSQIQALRQLYDFQDVDVDRYIIDGQYRQVMLAARELDTDRLPEDARGWVNKRLQFTHGYGLAMSPVNAVTDEGLPELFLQDIPPKGKLTVDRPEIYFGEKTDTYVIVNSKEKEFDYPLETSSVYASYEGQGGVRLNSFWRRLAYAWEFGDPNILISGQITGDSRLLYRRQVPDRVHTIAPFLRLDDDPYLVVADGRLFWIQDAYTVSDLYPYSQPYQGDFNYIRNSVKAVVDAYEGTVTLYIAEPNDPVVRTWAAIFPDLFKPIEEMPASLREHIRYPEGLFKVQAEMYRTYHMVEPQLFFNKEDLWNIPNELFFEKQQPLEPYYLIMRVPGEAEEEFVLILPFTPKNRDNTNAWLAARSDGEHYGSLISFRFPKDRLVFGPAQIEARINQDSKIAEQFTLWSRSGSQVLRGNLLMIPIGRSNLYVEPVFLQSQTSQLPELRRVVVANGNQIAMEATFGESLAVIFGQQPPTTPEVTLPPEGTPPAEGGQPGVEGTPEAEATLPPPSEATPTPAPVPTPTGDIAAVVQEAQAAYERAQTALRQGDFATYGEELDSLEAALERLVELTSSP